ncbi:BA14K family protein [Aminobacter anthyllidis]|uniref:Lectin-like protein BA14k n=1 Tax=Aminobacter anthyllidis TaxID=1035067 RepID=A0A9X1D982_9HYPH|nr:BA14K family protein [Aminobacter anthyllidis]MBT1160144.1 BA14K family protein [Aminobacter anthyllidis]
MKPLLMAVCGLGLALVMFLSGLITATAFFNAEPERQLSLATETTEVWTDHPVKVNKSAQAFDRLAARPVPRQSHIQSASPSVMPAVSALEKPSAGVEPNSQPPLQAETIAAHVAWCSDRYRSYRAYDNSYTPFSGRRRECISPYFDTSDGEDTYNHDQATDRPSEGSVELVYADDQNYVGTDHLEYCFSRYRSYRSEDNTYQPYDGGPRRQCR